MSLKPPGRSHVDLALRALARFWDNAVFGVRPHAYGVLSPRLRVLAVLLLLTAISLVKALPLLLALLLFSFGLVFVSILRKTFTLSSFLGCGFAMAAAFSMMMALPATINVFSHPDGSLLWSFGFMSHAVGITREGLHSAAMLLCRTLASAALVVWLTLSLRWLDLLKAFRGLGIPPMILQLAAMTVVFLHVMFRRVEEVHLAHKSRVLGKSGFKESSRWTGERLARAWQESLRLMEEVHHSMLARGFKGDVR